MIAGAASAARMTTYECLAEEGAIITDECFGMYMNLCHKIEIQPYESCNVMVFKPANIEWSTNEIQVDLYTYVTMYMNEQDAAAERAKVAALEAEMAARRDGAGQEEVECYYDDYYGEWYDYYGELCEGYIDDSSFNDYHRTFISLQAEDEEGGLFSCE